MGLRHCRSSARMLLSPSERRYICSGIEKDVRNDGRRRMDHRYFDLQTDVVLNANGSARLKLDRTDVLVAVKAAIEEPSKASPTRGRIVCSVECAPSASLRFGGRGAQTLNVRLTSSLQRVLRDALDAASLCIVPHRQCWVVYVDAIVLDSSGSLPDAISWAAYAALRSTTLPAIRVVRGDSASETVVEVPDDPFETRPLSLGLVPITVSLTKVGRLFVVDATAEEEACRSARITCAVNADGKLCSTHKAGAGGVSAASLVEMMRVAVQLGTVLIKKIDRMLQAGDEARQASKSSRDVKTPVAGFLLGVDSSKS